MISQLLSALGVYRVYQRWLRGQVDRRPKPKHIGVITDGNRRWAKSMGKISWEGHWEGADKVEEFLEWCLDLDIKTITLYSFSTENFKRDPREVEELMKLFEKTLLDVLESDTYHRNKIRIRAIGRTSMLPENIQELIKKVEDSTSGYDRYFLNIAIAYGGRAEIIDATRAIAEMVKHGELDSEDIDEEVFEKHLYTAHLPQPDPDLIIRTSGESRLSNFLVWQSAYSELFIMDVYWPAFRKLDFMRAIRSYQQRKRRYGK